MPVRRLELTEGEQVSTAAWKDALAMAQMFVRQFYGDAGLSADFDECKAELLRYVTVAAERVGRLAV